MAENETSLFTREQSRRLDQLAIEFGIPGLSLMENAGRAATDAICEHFSAPLADGALVHVIAGTGQNGGDGFVVARQLQARGFDVQVEIVGDISKIKGDAAPNLRALRRLPTRFVEESALESALSFRRTIVVDAVFGTGLTKAPRATHSTSLERMRRLSNHPNVSFVALDLPSGVCAETGQELGDVPPADLTVTFGGLKRGLTQMPGRELAGEIVLADIGVSADQLGVETGARWIGVDTLRSRIFPRSDAAHKGSAGHVTVLGGAPGMRGAGALAIRGALRGGAGLVTWVRDEPPREGSEWTSTPLDAPEIRQSSTLVIGPGIGNEPRLSALAQTLAMDHLGPAVIDADALNHIASRSGLEELKAAKGPRVITPHPLEAARLLSVDTAIVQKDRFGAAEKLASSSGAVVVLKGAGTIIAAPGSGFYVSRVMNSVLAVGGSGDVLAGLIAAFLADREVRRPALDAAILAVGVHGFAGECAGWDRGVLASEIADAIPKVISSLITPPRDILR